MKDVVIQGLKCEKLQEYKELIDDCFGESNDIETYKRMYSQNKNYEIIVAKLDGKIVGSITIVKVDLFTFSFQPSLELFNVAVKSEYRENKIGSVMMNYVKKYAKKNGYNSITLTCLEDLEYIHKFYEKVGFKKASSRKYAMYF